MLTSLRVPVFKQANDGDSSQFNHELYTCDCEWHCATQSDKDIALGIQNQPSTCWGVICL